MSITGRIVNLTYYFKTDSDLWLPAFGELFNCFKANITCFMVCLNKKLHNDWKIIPFIKKEITKFSTEIYSQSNHRALIYLESKENKW